jgi:hypothetical protein
MFSQSVVRFRNTAPKQLIGCESAPTCALSNSVTPIGAAMTTDAIEKYDIFNSVDKTTLKR